MWSLRYVSKSRGLWLKRRKVDSDTVGILCRRLVFKGLRDIKILSYILLSMWQNKGSILGKIYFTLVFICMHFYSVWQDQNSYAFRKHSINFTRLIPGEMRVKWPDVKSVETGWMGMNGSMDWSNKHRTEEIMWVIMWWSFQEGPWIELAGKRFYR